MQNTAAETTIAQNPYAGLDIKADNAAILAENGPQLAAWITNRLTEMIGSAQSQTTMVDWLDEAVADWLTHIENDTAAADWFVSGFGPGTGFDRNDLTADHLKALVVDIAAHDESLLTHGITAEEVAQAVTGMTLSLRRFNDETQGGYRSFSIHANAMAYYRARGVIASKKGTARTAEQVVADTRRAAVKTLALITWSMFFTEQVQTLEMAQAA